VKVDVDLRGVEALTERAVRELSPSSVLGVMLPPLVDAAARERDTHLYRNRTGNLERSTAAEALEATAERVSVSLQMTKPYAEFVWRRGLSELDTYGIQADQAIKRRFSEQLKRISG
jgi:hypothetical protein